MMTSDDTLDGMCGMLMKVENGWNLMTGGSRRKIQPLGGLRKPIGRTGPHRKAGMMTPTMRLISTSVRAYILVKVMGKIRQPKKQKARNALKRPTPLQQNKTLAEAKQAVARVRAARGYYNPVGMNGGPKGKGKGKQLSSFGAGQGHWLWTTLHLRPARP